MRKAAILLSLICLAGCSDKSVTYITGPTNPVYGPSVPTVPVPAVPTPAPSPSGN